MSPLVIGRSPTVLTIEWPQRERDQLHGVPIDATVNVTGLHATRRFPVFPAGLIAFWAELARDWKGWCGARTWEAEFGDLTLGCLHDGVGTIWAKIEMPPPRDATRDRGLVAWVAVAPGTLDSIVSGRRALFDEEPAS